MKVTPIGYDTVKYVFDYNVFAKLIIEECINVADETALGDTTYGWMVANRIREHFGIEQ